MTVCGKVLFIVHVRKGSVYCACAERFCLLCMCGKVLFIVHVRKGTMHELL